MAAVERDVKAGDDASPALCAHERPALYPHGKGRLPGADDLFHGAEIRRDHAALGREIYGQNAVAPAAQQIAHKHPRDDGHLALVGPSPEKDCDCRHTKNTSEEFFFRRCFFGLVSLIDIGQVVEKEHAVPRAQFLGKDILRVLQGGHDAQFILRAARREVAVPHL